MITLFYVLFAILLLSIFLCLYRIGLGPTVPDRTVAVDITGIILICMGAIFSAITGKDFYINVGLASGLLSFIVTIALSKYIEGRNYDE